MYARYKERKYFWEEFDAIGVLRLKNLIICGDMNFTLFSNEVWGAPAPLDLLGSFLQDLFFRNNLVDIHPKKLIPTWNNNHQGDKGGGKRLDRFFLMDCFLDRENLIFRTWNIMANHSNYCPIALQIEEEEPGKKFPFKFNQYWLKEESFCKMVREVWPTLLIDSGLNVMDRIVKRF